MRRRPVNTTPQTYTVTKRTVGQGSAAPVAPDVDWYTKPAEDLYLSVFSRVRHIKNSQVTRRYELFTYQQAYNSRFGPAISGSLYGPSARNPTASSYMVSVNLVQRLVDAAQARIAKSKPRAFVLPNKADYRLKSKCRKATKFLDGGFRASHVYSVGDEVFRDAGIYGTGASVLLEEDDQIRNYQVKADELHIDVVDGMYDDPIEIHWAHAWPRTRVIAKWPDAEKEINDARSCWRGEMGFMGQADMVEVIYSWRLAQGKQKGIFTICIATKTLQRDDWSKDYIPVFRFHWRPPTYGPFGTGIAKSVFGHQRAVTDIGRGILKSIRNFAVPRIWVSKQAGVATETISNEISVNTYSGEKPAFDTPPAASPDIYQYQQWLIDDSWKQEGLSQMSAQGEKPAGLNAAVALRTMQDIETERFAIVGQRWERDYYMALAVAYLDMACDIYKKKGAKKGAYSVKVPGRGFIESIDWAEIDLKADQYDVAVWPTNILPDSPEGRLQTIQEFTASGFMPKDVIISQTDNPIFYDWVAKETAPREQAEACIASILDDGHYIAPDGIGNLDIVLYEAQAAVLMAQKKDSGVEPHKFDLLMRFLNAATTLKAAAMAPPAPPPGAAGPAAGQPAGQPSALPPAPMAQAGAPPPTVPQAA